MNQSDSDSVFAGSIPQLYEQYLVPLIFEPYAADLSRRVVPRQPSRVLEIAAGTGVVTRQLAIALPAATSIIATDLNQPRWLDRVRGRDALEAAPVAVSSCEATDGTKLNTTA